jgi:putative hydrolase of the HAD superfamily
LTPKALIFDFGNVVGYFDHRRASRRLAAWSDLPVDALHAQLFGGRLEDDYESGRIDTAEFVRRARETCRLRCGDEDFGPAYADIFWPNPDVCALLPRLKPAHRLLLLSNTNELHARHFGRQFAEALAHFDGLVFSHEVGARKPAPAVFAHAQRLAGCAPQECLFIDDLPANVAAARAFGWQGLVYTDFPTLVRQLAEFDVRA